MMISNRCNKPFFFISAAIVKITSGADQCEEVRAISNYEGDLLFSQKVS